MFSINYNTWGWYAAFLTHKNYWPDDDGYLYFGTAGWQHCMTNGNEYFPTLEKLTNRLLKEGLDNGKVNT